MGLHTPSPYGLEYTALPPVPTGYVPQGSLQMYAPAQVQDPAYPLPMQYTPFPQNIAMDGPAYHYAMQENVDPPFTPADGPFNLGAGAFAQPVQSAPWGCFPEAEEQLRLVREIHAQLGYDYPMGMDAWE